MGDTLIPAVAEDRNVSTPYLIETWDDQSLALFRIDGLPGSESLRLIGYPTALDPWAFGPADFDPDFAPQKDGDLIDAFNANAVNLVLRNGSLWCVHTVFLPELAPTRTAVQWWQVTLDGSVLQRGRIDDPTGARFFAYPSLAVNRDNQVLVGFNQFGADIYAGASYAYRAAADPPGTLRSVETLKDGEGPYRQLLDYSFDELRLRWGDYSTTVTDPLNDADFWTIQEYASLPGWATEWGEVLALPPEAPVASFETPPVGPVQGVPTRLRDTSAGGPIEWAWDFGDGTGSAEESPAKAWTALGVYEVTLTVSNRAGSSSTRAAVTVGATPRRASPVPPAPPRPGPQPLPAR